MKINTFIAIILCLLVGVQCMVLGTNKLINYKISKQCDKFTQQDFDKMITEYIKGNK